MDRRGQESYVISLGGVVTTIAAVFLGVLMGRIVEDMWSVSRPAKSLLLIDTSASWVNLAICVWFFVGAICIMYFGTQCVRGLAINYATSLAKKTPFRIPRQPVWLALGSYAWCYLIWPYLTAGILLPVSAIGIGVWAGWYITLILTLARVELWPI